MRADMQAQEKELAELPHTTWRDIVQKLFADAQSESRTRSTRSSKSKLRKAAGRDENHQGSVAGLTAHVSPLAATASEQPQPVTGPPVHAVHAHDEVATGVLQALLPLPQQLWDCFLGALWPEVNLQGVRLSCIEWGNVLASLGRVERRELRRYGPVLPVF